MTERDPAIGRLWILTLVRLAGIGLVLAGLWLAGSSAGALPRLVAGLVLMAGGGAFSLLAPRALARRWKG